MEIKEKLRNFGILVIRRFWSIKGGGIQRLGILALGIGVLLGVSQAGTIQRLIAGSTDSSAATLAGVQPSTASFNNKTVATADAASTTAGDEKLSGATNIVDLIGDSDLIVRGTIKELTDGIEDGVPYTQVTLQVTEALRGQFGEEYSYRQFGLLQPKKMGNGKVNLNVSPDGWAKYALGEDVLLFLYREASVTGLRTTVGLGQGKIDFNAGNAETQFGNTGLFQDVAVDNNLTNDSDKRLLGTKKGPVNKDALMSLVKRAVNGKWVEGRKLRHAKK